MKLNYGWVIVGAGMVATGIGLGTILALGVFLQPMAAATGWSRAGISTAATLSFLSMGVASFLWGMLSDRFGTRAVVLAGGVLLGIGLGLASEASTLLQFQLCFGVLAGVAAGSFYAPLTASAAGWFTRHRSLAVALVSAGIGMGSMTMAPLAGWLIAGHGWRTALLVLGGLAWLLILPAALLVRAPPSASTRAPLDASRAASAVALLSPGRGEPREPHGADSSRAALLTTAGGAELTVAQALRTPQFAVIALTYFACCAAHSGPIFHMVSYAIDCGVPPLTAASVISVGGFAGLMGRVVCGLVADRVGAKPTLVAGLGVQAVAISLYLVVHDLSSFYALALMFGLAYGGVMPLYAVLVREYFGARIMGSVFGAVAMTSSIGMALGPWAGGWLFDLYASYSWLYIGSSAIGLGAAAIALTFRPPRVATAALPA
jgi:MFS family permease